jgi:mannose-6-phosphate isomerase-like protein (cupin superfamily)
MKKMYYSANGYPYHNPYYANMPMNTYYSGNVDYGRYRSEPFYAHPFTPYHSYHDNNRLTLKDYGPNPYVVNINAATKQNKTYRRALWTGDHLQVTLMSLNPGEDIGLEMHPNVDQFLRIEQGQGITRMGKSKENLNFSRKVNDDSAIIVPAGTWHNLTNTGNVPLKLYSIYAPPNHPFGTVHRTKADAMAAEHGNRYSNGNNRYFW